MDVLLERQENLVGVDGLDEIVGYLGADGLVHDVFFLALGTHYHRCGRLYVLDLLQCLQTAESWHHLVKQDEVEGLLAALLDGVGSVAYCDNLVTFFLEEDDVGLEKFHLIIYP